MKVIELMIIAFCIIVTANCAQKTETKLRASRPLKVKSNDFNTVNKYLLGTLIEQTKNDVETLQEFPSEKNTYAGIENLLYGPLQEGGALYVLLTGQPSEVAHIKLNKTRMEGIAEFEEITVKQGEGDVQMLTEVVSEIENSKHDGNGWLSLAEDNGNTAG